ncbi:capsule assembly Wzi family protein [Vibrio agarivorans]|uniref:Capsule assembly Wzi family protein n=1 Tax=Vibrio agarivorans TaxID=153622 RepID=A0ABT7XW33_9VIBR|nr:hypothetical protein [Vibrio agarivorans]MDN2479982.1 hypothetical protein [Vibrio agarivorans]
MTAQTKQHLNYNKSKVSVKVARWLPFTVLMPLAVNASPWIETNDPFLRASLHKLSDNLLLQAPLSSYPLRWNVIGDDIKRAHTPDNTRYAMQYVRHTMNNAQFARGNVMAKAIYQSNPQAHLGYGSMGTDHWGIYTSYDHMSEDFSFRLSINYADSMKPTNYLSGVESDYDTDVNFKGSHLSFNAGFALISLGYLERWWGPTWQHNLQQGNFGESSPSLQLSWVGDQMPVIGFWNLDSAINYIDQESNYVWLNRFTAKPLTQLEFGLNYQLSDKDNQDEKLASYGIDARLSLPKVAQLSHAVYANWQQTQFGHDSQAISYGWEGQFQAFDAEMTLVLEGQHVDEQQRDRWTGPQQQVLNDYSSLLWGDSASVALYALLNNDHRITAVYRNSESDSTQEKATQIDYHIPFQQGMFSFGLGYVDYTSLTKTIDEPNFLFGYEYRY